MLFVYFCTHFESVINILFLIPSFNLIVAFGTLFIGKVFLSRVSLLSIRYFNHFLPFKKIFTIYNNTQMAKYIPGSIWQYVGKAGAYAKEGIDSTTIKKSLILETLWILFSASLLGIILVLTGSTINFNYIVEKIENYFLVYLCVFSILVIFCFYFYKNVKSFFKTIFLNRILNLRMILMLLIIWFSLGASFFTILTPHIVNPNISQFLNVVGLYALAYAIGFLVPFAPAGVGIREALLVAGISGIIGAERAIVLASLNRIIYIIMEVFIVFMIAIVKFVRIKISKTTKIKSL